MHRNICVNVEMRVANGCGKIFRLFGLTNLGLVSGLTALAGDKITRTYVVGSDQTAKNGLLPARLVPPFQPMKNLAIE